MGPLREAQFPWIGAKILPSEDILEVYFHLYSLLQTLFIAAQRRQSAAARMAYAIRQGTTQYTPPMKNQLCQHNLLEFETP